MTDTGPMTIIEHLKAWKQCLEENDIEEAVRHHDVVQAHILQHNDGVRVFQVAQMDPNPFIQWADLKKVIKEQLAKSPEQRRADYDEAVEQLVDLVGRIADADEPRQVFQAAGHFGEALQQVTLNASCLSVELPEEKEETEEEPETFVETEEKEPSSDEEG